MYLLIDAYKNKCTSGVVSIGRGNYYYEINSTKTINEFTYAKCNVYSEIC